MLFPFGPGNVQTDFTKLTTVQARQGRHSIAYTPRCDTENLMSLLVSLQIVDPENIVKLAYKGNLGSFCKKVSGKLGETYGYLKTCLVTPQQHLYTCLLSGITSLYQTLCLDSGYQKSFVHHSKCFRKLYDEVDNCNGPRDWAEDTNRTRLCKAYQNIIDCYLVKSALICGPDAADVFKKLIINVLRATVVTDCGIRCKSTSNNNTGQPIISQKAFILFYLAVIFLVTIALFMVCKRGK